MELFEPGQISKTGPKILPFLIEVLIQISPSGIEWLRWKSIDFLVRFEIILLNKLMKSDKPRWRGTI